MKVCVHENMYSEASAPNAAKQSRGRRAGMQREHSCMSAVAHQVSSSIQHLGACKHTHVVHMHACFCACVCVCVCVCVPACELMYVWQ